MAAKKTKFDPVHILISVQKRRDGALVFSYTGTDPRTPEWGSWILKLIDEATR
jgi:hypothetical protein